jgi:predicted metal-dependent HD superfamily phosphohydrolase
LSHGSPRRAVSRGVTWCTPAAYRQPVQDPGPALDRDRWRSLLRSLGAAGPLEPIDAAFDALVARYREPHRHYHDVAHIRAVLAAVDPVIDGADDPRAVELALWFHDAIYETTAGDNEARSAALGRAVCQGLGVADSPDSADSPLARACAHILATAHGPAIPAGDAALVVDADLSILGASAAEFDAYDQSIRREYAWVPDAHYRQARARVLQGFRERPAIFLTPAFAALDRPARENLARALARLA